MKLATICRCALLILLIAVPVAPGGAKDQNPTWKVLSGGFFRFPNSQQASDEGNAMLEAWVKASATFFSAPNFSLSFLLRVKTVADTAGFSFNNSTTVGPGVAVEFKPAKDTSVSVGVRHDWQAFHLSEQRRDGWRAFLDHFFIKVWRAAPTKANLGAWHRSNVLVGYGSFTLPDTLRPGDDNAVYTAGLEYLINFRVPETSLTIAPFLSTSLSLDWDQNSFNNKIQPSLGVKLRWRKENGDIFAGLRYIGDYRWVNDTFRHGPNLIAGWNLSF